MTVGGILPSRITTAAILPAVRMILMLLVKDVGQFHLNDPITQEYDFIVVGSGSAGSIIATRLSEIEGWRVLVIEEGGIPPPDTHIIPFIAGQFIPGNTNTKSLHTVSQRNSHFNFVNQQARIIQGRLLGGTSSTNGLIYVRGSSQDFDNWAALGNPGWDYKSVLKYFKKFEKYHAPPGHYGNAPPYYGQSGPISVTPAPSGFLTKAFMRGGGELGYPVNEDPNGPQQLGFSRLIINVHEGTRASTAERYLKPASRRPNLHILHSAMVQQIIFNDKAKAVGVRLIHNGKVQTIGAKREVIVSGGAIGSPKLLLLSGVGPKEHLQEIGVKVVADVPGVGSNFQDHFGVLGLCWTVNKGTLLNSVPNFKPSTIRAFTQSRTGPLTMYPGEYPSSWLNVGGDDDPLWPNLMMYVNSHLPTYDLGLYYPAIVNMKKRAYLDHFSNLFGKEGFCVNPEVLRPKSKGIIRLRSTDPKAHPIIHPNYISNREDIITLIRGIKKILDLGNTTAFKDYLGARYHDMPLRGCSSEIYGSDAYWECYIRHMGTTFYHYVGSCKMAPSSDPLGVVDSRLRVRGVDGLRIADSSIMPQITTGNTNSPTMMIGEKAADLIKEDWLGSYRG